MGRAVVAGAVALALGGWAATPTAAAPDHPGRFGPPVYLALGDSVPAGVGAQPGVTGYPELLGALLEDGYDPAADKATPGRAVDFDVHNLAVSGATTATLIEDQLPAALRTIERRDANRDPFDDVEVVTVTVGGNDVIGTAGRACLSGPPLARCQVAVDAALDITEDGLTAILGQLATAAGRDAEVVVTTYDNPIASCSLGAANPAAVAIADAVLEGGTVPGAVTVEDGLNDRIRGVAAATGAQVAEVYGALDTDQFVGGTDCLHPNAAGHAEIAEIIYATVAR